MMKGTMLAFVAVVAAMTVEAKFSKMAFIDGNTPVGMTLEGDTIYEVVDNVTLSAQGAGACALRVNPNTTTALMIPKGITLTLQGSPASGRSGAGPAVQLPGNATLVILGEGRLIAAGGRAAGATAASSRGGDARFYLRNVHCSLLGIEWDDPLRDDLTRFTSGGGGRGGQGGGGASAAIGGGGGTGGAGGSGASARKRQWSGYASFRNVDFLANGASGDAGGNGSSGGSCGRVVLLGSVDVSASAGGSSGAGSASHTSHGSHVVGHTKDFLSAMLYNGYSAGGGGGGGGGGGALRPPTASAAVRPAAAVAAAAARAAGSTGSSRMT